MTESSLEKVIRESIEKLHMEVAQETISMYLGLFICILIASMSFLYWQHSGKIIAVEFMLAALVSGAGWIVRSEVLFHSPDEYLRRAEQAFADTDKETREDEMRSLGGWNTFRQQLKARNVILIAGDILSATLVWFMLLRYFSPGRPENIVGVLMGLLIIGIVMIPITAKYASAR